MNSRNLSRFHNFKKKIKEIKIQLQSFLHSSPIQIQKRKENKEKKRKYTLNYTMNPSSLQVLGVESEKVGGYFIILTLSIYICQKKMGRMHNDPGRIPRRKSLDNCLKSRP